MTQILSIESFNAFTKGNPSDSGIVLLHGLLGASRNLYRLAQYFADRGYFVLAYDQRGHGHSPHFPETEYTLQKLGEDVFRMMDRFGMKKAHLIGHSLGGRVALSATALNPDRVLSLTMLDVGVNLNKDAYEALRKIIEPLPDFFSTKEEAESFLTTHSSQMRLFLLSNLRTQDGKLSWTFDLRSLRQIFLKSLFYENQLEAFKKISRPILLARGEKSAHFPKIDQERLLTLIPNAKGATIPNAEHWVHADNFEGTAKVISDFLQSVG